MEYNENFLSERKIHSATNAELEELKAELERREELLREGEQLLAERLRFVEESESLLEAKGQELAETETRLEQMKEDLDYQADSRPAWGERLSFPGGLKYAEAVQ